MRDKQFGNADSTRTEQGETTPIPNCNKCGWPNLRPGEVMGTYVHDGNCPSCGAKLPTMDASLLDKIIPAKFDQTVTLSTPTQQGKCPTCGGNRIGNTYPKAGPCHDPIHSDQQPEGSLLDRAREVNAEMEAVADDLIARKGPGWRRLAIVRERDELTREVERLRAERDECDKQEERPLTEHLKEFAGFLSARPLTANERAISVDLIFDTIRALSSLQAEHERVLGAIEVVLEKWEAARDEGYYLIHFSDAEACIRDALSPKEQNDG